MPITASAIALLAASSFATFAIFAAAPCRAADAGAGYKAGKQAKPASAAAHAGTGRRSGKEASRRIVTYNLFQDPEFKLKGALADKRQLGVAPVPALQPANAADKNVLKLQEPDTSGIGFGCSDKPFGNAKTRELTACYKHSVDRSWKAQTYVSRETTAEGNQKWGGGMAVRYAY
ncbi:hypothetical protein [Noviherbaspirillum sp.]|uniref:hypothetical protein n=1 Tax=Noviherbaspirillum sp. TaxID=1926288 RepID=UPI002D2469A7|nr:hypothetical protein [Noviherbaspirillum sp.]HZW20992.1 hypothetical protein [Noviherbaspirillum sp.]